MFDGKETKVVFTDEVARGYEELNKIVGEEIKKGDNNSIHQTLLRAINRVKELLKDNPFVGIQIPKKQIPNKYIIKYEVNNLWKINLPDYWRMIYTVTSEEVKIISLVLAIINHEEYNKIFGYK